jgi:hypothetical protein
VTNLRQAGIFPDLFVSDGKEIALSHTIPGDWLRTAVRTSLDGIGMLLYRVLTEPVANLRGETALASPSQREWVLIQSDGQGSA